jgi:hypothetical protein
VTVNHTGPRGKRGLHTDPSRTERPGMNVTALVLVWAATAPAKMTKTFAHDFRRGGGLPPVLTRFGPDAARVIKQESGGLRITLPAKRTKLAAVGVSPRFAVSGDFEISTTFDNLTIERPSKGYGSGVRLYLVLESAKEETAGLARVTRVKEGDVYLTNHIWKQKDGKTRDQVRTFPTLATAGRLCIRRVGSSLHYLIADGLNGDLQEIAQAEIGTEDLRSIRLAANTGGSPSALDVRLLDLRIGSDRLPNQPTHRSSVSGWWLVLGGVGVVLLLVAGGVVYARRRAALLSASRENRVIGARPLVDNRNTWEKDISVLVDPALMRDTLAAPLWLAVTLLLVRAGWLASGRLFAREGPCRASCTPWCGAGRASWGWPSYWGVLAFFPG